MIFTASGVSGGSLPTRSLAICCSDSSSQFEPRFAPLVIVWELKSILKRLGVESSGVVGGDARFLFVFIADATGISGALGVKKTSSSPELRLTISGGLRGEGKGGEAVTDPVRPSEGVDSGLGGGRDNLPVGFGFVDVDGVWPSMGFGLLDGTSFVRNADSVCRLFSGFILDVVLFDVLVFEPGPDFDFSAASFSLAIFRYSAYTGLVRLYLT